MIKLAEQISNDCKELKKQLKEEKKTDVFAMMSIFNPNSLPSGAAAFSLY